MSYFLLPEIHHNIENINIQSNEKDKLYVSLTLNSYLNNVKKQIDENYDSWDYTKRYTNPYEFIHTVIPNTKCSVSKMKPLSRSFYKMVEMVNMFRLFNDFGEKTINTFHLAEGPGGFIEATQHLRQNDSDKYYGMTLMDEDPNVPGWKKSNHFLETHKNVEIERGVTGTGDLMEVDNLKYCNDKYKNSMDIITADGGFDFSIDFNQQEILATNLLLAQVSFAISMQKVGGHFILKIFDIFTKTTCDIMYLLSSLYKQVYIVKPNTSRLANSEKYIVCKGFKKYPDKLINNIIRKYDTLKTSEFISGILQDNLDYFYLNKIEEYNAIFGQQQIENINTTLNLISCKNKNEKIETLKKNNIQKSTQWCEKNNIVHNKNLASTNIFIL
jgi:23S rRNA U2552 (ribose-2'-O)-methylase RlmE/FtsJ|tara:strand:+ start:1684 stop:2841 length:1158 start_codon:yes stop_codon:yes gene_type:complete